MDKNEKRAHIIILPFPVQGHINPMLQFSKRLVSKGLKVTLVTSFTNPNSIQSQVDIEDISDSSETDTDLKNVEVILNHFNSLVSLKLPQAVDKHNKNGQQVKYVIYDSILPSVFDIARELGLSAAPFFTQPCMVNAIYYSLYRRVIEVPIEERDLPLSLEGLPSLELYDLPSFLYDQVSYPPMLSLVLKQFDNFGEADCVFFNTFDSLEQEVIKWATSQWPVIKSIGPTIPSMYLDKQIENDKDYGLSLFKSESDVCMKWLNSKDNTSVVYISFGSLASLQEEQMEEIAIVLQNSKRHFLWVVRKTEWKRLPRNFVENTSKSEKGLVVNWCNQLEVLSHKSVACFVTHCGWNSTLEALSLGVAMMSIPQWSDQTTNAKFVMDVWKVGMRAKFDADKGIVTRQELEICINEVVDGERANEIKSNSQKWSQLARAALEEGGTSEKNIEQFVAMFG